jgi:hypothetical protein
MPGKAFVFAIIAIVLTGAARAQQKQGPEAGTAEDVKQMCRQEITKVCRPGLVPDRAAILRCVTDNKDRFPAQCQRLPIFQRQQ